MRRATLSITIIAPDPGDVALTYAMIDAGADAIVGHHSHRLQPLDFYGGKPIFWSLGISAFIAAPGHPILTD